MMRLLKSSFLIANLIALCACQHQNPLKTHTKQETLRFLLDASANAEKRLHIPTQKDSYGYAYLECMDGKAGLKLPCDALYQGMVSFAKEQHHKSFKHLTLKDVTDHTLVTSLADDYAEFAATHEPHIYSEKHS